MKTLNLTRGHESDEHIALKREVIRFLHNWGYGAVLCEHHDSDLVAIQPGRAAILGVEIERADRHAPTNLFRDFSQGCADVLIVCPNLKILGEVARKLSRTVPKELLEKTALATISALRLTQPNHFPGSETREFKPKQTS